MSADEILEEQRVVRILLCDDHRMLTDAFAMVIELDPEIELCHEPTADPEEALALAQELRPDVVLMDVDLNASMDGIEATEKIKAVVPETKVVILTASQNRDLIVRAVEAGASAFLRKSIPVDEVVSSLKAAAAGETLIDPVELSAVLREVARAREHERDASLLLGQLTARETEILQLLAEGKRNEDIAALLVISPQTVQTHVRNVLSKLGVHSKLEAVAFAARNGVVDRRGKSL